MVKPESLRERTRTAVRAELTDAALELFEVQGYDATTVEQIAAHAGLSKRSFFRYFTAKEDAVLATSNLEAFGHRLATELAGRPPDEPAWTALRRSFDLLLQQLSTAPQRSRLIVRLAHETPALRARHLEKQLRWAELLAPHLSERLCPAEHPGPDPRPLALASAALGCLDAAQASWLESADNALPGLLDIAMTALRPLEVSTRALP